MRADNGVLNFFSTAGKRLFYNPRKGVGVFHGKEGFFCGVLAIADGKFQLVLTEESDVKSILFVEPSVNTAPVAVATADKTTVFEGENVNLDGSGSYDPDGDRLTYSWTQTLGPDVDLFRYSSKPSFTAPWIINDPVILSFRLTVSDGKRSDTASVTITVKKATLNQPPVAKATADKTTATEGEWITLDGSGSSDPDGDRLTYLWAQTLGPEVTLSSTTALETGFTAPDVSNGPITLRFRLTVSDGKDTDNAFVTITVNKATLNQPPVAKATADKTTATEGEWITFDGSGSSDPDGDRLTYLWAQTLGPEVTLSSTTALETGFTAPDVSNGPITLRFRLTVSDGKDTDNAFVTITVNKATLNQPPVAKAAADKTSVAPGENVTLDGSGSYDPDGTIGSYGWSQIDTTGVAVTLSNPNTVKASFTAPDISEDSISLVFELRVTDDNGDNAADNVRITIKKSSGGGSGGGGGCFISCIK